MRMLALATYEDGICQCGFHESWTADKDNAFTFESRVCPVCSATDCYDRIQHAADDDAVKNLGDPKPSDPRPADGRRTFVRPMSPAEVAGREATKTA